MFIVNSELHALDLLDIGTQHEPVYYLRRFGDIEIN